MDSETTPEGPLESSHGQLVLEMLQHVAISSATVQSQQRGDPELTVDEKIAVLKDVFVRRPGDFLMRFGRYLRRDHLACFKSIRQDYEVDFRAREVELLLDRDKNRMRIRNRRFEYLQQQMSHGDYFCDREMRKRNPLLYEQYVGQYLTEQERKELNLDVSSDVGLSAQLLDQLERLRTAELLARQQDQENQEEEEDDSDDSENELECYRDQQIGSKQLHAAEEKKTAGISTREKRLLRDECVSIMHQLFLTGSDKDFDYQQVDNCCDYDSLEIRERDEEEAYFDDEEPETWPVEDTAKIHNIV